MGQLGLFNISNGHFQIQPKLDRSRLPLRCASSNRHISAQYNPQSQRQEPGSGRREPPGRGGGGGGRGGSGRSSPQRQQTQLSNPKQRETNRKQSQTPPTPKYDMLIVVEGVNDMKAVRRALNADVYVLGTATRAGDPAVHKDLLSFLEKYRGVLLLLDPDVAGRQARNALNKVIPDCWHAFVPTPLAEAVKARGYKEIGNIGVEHARPPAILEALSRRRKGVEGRTEFSKEILQEVGLAATDFERGGNVRERRTLVCNFLGVGTSDGKQLVKQLNTYGFSKQDLQAALSWAEQQLLIQLPTTTTAETDNRFTKLQ